MPRYSHEVSFLPAGLLGWACPRWSRDHRLCHAPRRVGQIRRRENEIRRPNAGEFAPGLLLIISCTAAGDYGQLLDGQAADTDRPRWARGSRQESASASIAAEGTGPSSSDSMRS